ncbi:MAG: DUF192 domain-containing protein [Pseudomonadota bacterium]
MIRAAGLAATLAVGLGTGAWGADDQHCAPDAITLNADGGPVVFSVEIADDAAEHSRGLMFRPELAREAGMLFLYDVPRPAAFWMRNTMIPLDMIFIDDAGLVLNIEADAQPYTETPRRSEGPVRAVLEINGGLSAELGIGPGTQAVHPAFRGAPEEHLCAAPS